MGYLILVVLLIICAFNWLLRYISAMTLLYYMESKEYTLPTGPELKACTDYVVKHIVGDIFKNKN